MKTSLKNNDADFINFKEFLYAELLDREFIIEVPKAINFFETYRERQNKYDVIINQSKIVSWNFRVVYTTFPENLIFLCNGFDKKVHLLTLINKVSKEKIIDPSPSLSKRILQRNFLEFFHFIFFADLFNSVFKGEYIDSRVFAFKSESKLWYFNLFQRFILPQVLLKYIKIDVRKNNTNIEMESFCLTFDLDYGVFIEDLKLSILNQFG